MSNCKIAAVIVTYNRKKLLEQNITAILSQNVLVDKIIIIDNHSNDGTEEYIKTLFKDQLKIFQYIFLDSNIGGAGGFETGVRIAYNEGFDLIWLMDDDGRPGDHKTLESLLIKIKKMGLDKKQFIINSLVLFNELELSFGLFSEFDKKDDILKKSKSGIISDRVNPFNGTLISRELVSTIGYPDGRFFIKGDETDYIIRAKRAKAFIGTDVESLYFHPKPFNKYLLLGNLKINIETEEPWKEYYRMRNYIYMKKRDQGIIGCIKYIIRSFLRITLSKGEKMEILKICFKGFVDGYSGKLGVTIRP